MVSFNPVKICYFNNKKDLDFLKCTGLFTALYPILYALKNEEKILLFLKSKNVDVMVSKMRLFQTEFNLGLDFDKIPCL